MRNTDLQKDKVLLKSYTYKYAYQFNAVIQERDRS